MGRVPQVLLSAHVVYEDGEVARLEIGHADLQTMALDELADWRSTLEVLARLVADARRNADEDVLRRMRIAGTWTLHADTDAEQVTVKSTFASEKVPGHAAEALRNRLRALAFEGRLPAERVDEVLPQKTVTLTSARVGDLRKLADATPNADVAQAILDVLPERRRTISIERVPHPPAKAEETEAA